jgi:hypothetical protein
MEHKVCFFDIYVLYNNGGNKSCISPTIPNFYNPSLNALFFLQPQEFHVAAIRLDIIDDK